MAIGNGETRFRMFERKKMKIVSYNVNGLRSAISKGFITWLRSVNPDVICLQEIKAKPEQIEVALLEAEGYRHFWFPAQKKGYSGVAIFSKIEPKSVVHGAGHPPNDLEGRIIRVDFPGCSVMSIYVPSGSSGEERQAFKMEWLSWFRNYMDGLRKEKTKLVLAGDFNVCHKPIDIHNPISNANSSGFLPEERQWMEEFIQMGFVDTFRHFNDQPHEYTWWTFRAGARGRNLGWRIDYQFVTDNLKGSLIRAIHLPDAKHSDHCPVLMELDV